MNYRINFIIRFSLRDLSFLNLCFRRHGPVESVSCAAAAAPPPNPFNCHSGCMKHWKTNRHKLQKLWKQMSSTPSARICRGEKCAELWKVRFHSYPFVEFCFCLFFRLFQRYTSMFGVFVFVFVFASLFRCVFYFMYIFSIYFRYFIFALFL